MDMVWLVSDELLTRDHGERVRRRSTHLSSSDEGQR